MGIFLTDQSDRLVSDRQKENTPCPDIAVLPRK